MIDDTVVGVIVEPRVHFAVPHVLSNFHKVLPAWPVYFYCGKGLRDHWIRQLSPPRDVLTIVELETDNLTANEYNDLFKRADFWKQLPDAAEKVLVFQTDAILCENSPYPVEAFFRYDYVGGYGHSENWWSERMPWVKHSHYKCFNGGLSLRSKRAMLDCIEKFPPIASADYWKHPSTNICQYAEDMYFVRAMYALGYRVGLDEFASRFCTHSTFRTETFGAHKFYAFFDAATDGGFLQYCPEGAKVIPYSRLNFMPEIDKFQGTAWGAVLKGLKDTGLQPLRRPSRVVTFDSFVERTFIWGGTPKYVHTSAWVGVIHNPPNVPPQLGSYYRHTPAALAQLPNFRESMKHCRGLVVLSQYLAKKLAEMPMFRDVPIACVYHSRGGIPHGLTFDFGEWEKNRQIIQVGFWLRRKLSIYELPAPRVSVKAIMPYDSRMDNEVNYEKRVMTCDVDLSEENVRRISKLPLDDYYRILCASVIFLDLYDSSANTTILECICFATPLIINRIPAVEEYLGESYPLYFDSLQHASQLADDVDRLHETHEYLLERRKIFPLENAQFGLTLVNSTVYPHE